MNVGQGGQGGKNAGSIEISSGGATDHRQKGGDVTISTNGGNQVALPKLPSGHIYMHSSDVLMGNSGGMYYHTGMCADEKERLSISFTVTFKIFRH